MAATVAIAALTGTLTPGAEARPGGHDGNDDSESYEPDKPDEPSGGDERDRERAAAAQAMAETKTKSAPSANPGAVNDILNNVYGTTTPVTPTNPYDPDSNGNNPKTNEPTILATAPIGGGGIGGSGGYRPPRQPLPKPLQPMPDDISDFEKALEKARQGGKGQKSSTAPDNQEPNNQDTHLALASNPNGPIVEIPASYRTTPINSTNPAANDNQETDTSWGVNRRTPIEEVAAHDSGLSDEAAIPSVKVMSEQPVRTEATGNRTEPMRYKGQFRNDATNDVSADKGSNVDSAEDGGDAVQPKAAKDNAAKVVDPTAVCVDTGAINDGWGWDGSESCRLPVRDLLHSDVAECVDSDGDGWGWTGTTSCLMPNGHNS